VAGSGCGGERRSPPSALTWTSTVEQHVIGASGHLAGSFLHGHDGTYPHPRPGPTRRAPGKAAFKAAPTRRHRPGRLGLADGERALVEDRSGEDGIGTTGGGPSTRCSSVPTPPDATTGCRWRQRPPWSGPDRSRPSCRLGPSRSTGSRRHRGVGTRQPTPPHRGRSLAPAVGVDLQPPFGPCRASTATTTHWAPNSSASSETSSGRSMAAV